MNRFRELERYPKIILILLLLMAVVFTTLYGVAASRVGFLHNGKIYIPRHENGVTLYEANVDGQASVITVTDDSVTLSWGGKSYGPYTLHEDPTAVPEEDAFSQYMTGMEILDGDRVFFRGGIMDNGGDFYLYHEDGSLDYAITVTTSDGIEVDMFGNPIDHMEPAPHEIIALLRGPELTHKGAWEAWFVGLLACLITAFSIFFADELFHLGLAFRVRDAEYAEPSDWEIASRYIGWTILPIFILGLFIRGLM